ncbi:TolC family protein [Roseateles amylovorans]|uniref:TolC family protein n=1 Tax=Roseateles amylovorans TaxID=2978473 RepID=A0ABY6B276_9BURK|nr:TolC family protein [Roseateles amylovorans]UXH79284.1 TolC family protein [Roseateles amylovorans]
MSSQTIPSTAARAAPSTSLQHRATKRRALGSVLASAAAVLLGGCASLSPEQAIAPVQQQSQAWLSADLPLQQTDDQRAAARQRTEALLAQPLDAQAAVQLALLNHRGLQASLYGLGMAESERVQTLLWPNPVLSLGRLVRGDEREIERGLSVNLLALLGRPARQDASARTLAREQARVAQQLLDIAGQARRRWIDAVAAQAQQAHARTVLDSASAGAELTLRMRQAGNVSALRLARERAVLAEAQLAMEQAQLQAVREREALIRAIGLWGDDVARLSLPERLPDVPSTFRQADDLERTAVAQRLDIQAAKRQSEALAAQLGLTRQTGRLNALELGLQRNSSNQAPTQRGLDLSLEVPLFDWGQARIVGAQQAYLQSVEQTAQTAIDARSEVREASERAQAAWRIARRHHDELLPLARQVSDETLLRYNGMLIGVMDLLADARAQARAVSAALGAQRDFWLAEATLSQSLLGPVHDTASSASPNTSSTPGASTDASGAAH